MSKKTIIISLAVLIIIAAGVGLSYQQGWFDKWLNKELTTEKILAMPFANQNPNIPAETFKLYEQRFVETKSRLQKDSDNMGDWLYLGALKKAANDFEGARDAFLYAAKIRPNSSTPFANLADLYMYFLNDPIKAEANIKKAIVNDPEDYNFYLSLADIYRYKFKDGESRYEKTMMEAIAKLPDNPNLISALAGFYKQTEQTQKAIEYYEKLLVLSPDNQAAKEDLAELKQK